MPVIFSELRSGEGQGLTPKEIKPKSYAAGIFLKAQEGSPKGYKLIFLNLSYCAFQKILRNN